MNNTEDKILEERADIKVEDASDEKHLEKEDPYSYTRQDFTSEVFKIEVGNLPKYVGFGQLRKFFNVKMRLDTRKIKAIGTPPHHVFVTFKNEEDRMNALKSLNGYLWKGKNLVAKLANPAADPYVMKRKAGDSEESIPMKRIKGDSESISDILKNAVTPFWNIPYEEQLKKKEEQLNDFLKSLRKGLEKANKDFKLFLNHNSEDRVGCCKVGSIKPSPVISAYRNKCEFTVGRDLMTKMKTVGFRLNRYKEGSMSVASPDECINISEAMLKAVKTFEVYVRESDKDVFNPETHEGYWRQLTVRTSRNNDVLIIVVMHPQILTKDELDKEQSQLRDYFENGSGSNSGITSVYFQIFDKRHIAENKDSNIVHLCGKTNMEETLLDMTFQISPEAFFQINVAAAEVLYRTIAEKVGTTDSTTVFDICCGTGTIGLFLAKCGAKSIGIEICPEAIENAKVNAKLNDITTAEFMCGKAEDVISSAIRKCDNLTNVVAVANPPRAGLHPKVLKVIRSTENLKRLVYVSCNPKAAINNFIDLCRPTSNNYRGPPFHPVEVVPIDMFPHTPHYELILVFERENCT